MVNKYTPDYKTTMMLIKLISINKYDDMLRNITRQGYLLSILLFSSIISGCGLKGPLYEEPQNAPSNQAAEQAKQTNKQTDNSTLKTSK